MKSANALGSGVGRRIASLAFAAALVLTVAPSSAEAQLGGLVRKAKDKVVRQAADQSGVNAAVEGEDVKFTAVIVELTPETLDKVMLGMRAGRARVDNPNGRAALVKERDDAGNESSALWNRHGDEINAWNDKRHAIDRCRRDAFNALDKGRDEALSKKAMTDPAFQGKIVAMMQQAALAQQKGDTTALSKLESDLRALRGESKADTVAVDKQCGATMAPNATEAKIRALQQKSWSIDAKIRDLDASADSEDAKASGLEPRQYAMARERIEMYLMRAKSESPQRGFNSNELKSLSARRADLEKLM
jgi:hypothetical protein